MERERQTGVSNERETGVNSAQVEPTSLFYVTALRLRFKLRGPRMTLWQQACDESLPQPDPHTHAHHAEHERGHQAERCTDGPPQRTHEGRHKHDQKLLHTAPRSREKGGLPARLRRRRERNSQSRLTPPLASH